MPVPLIEYSRFNSWVAEFPWRRDGLPTPVFLGFPGGSDSKESACSVGDLGLIPGLPLLCLEGVLDLHGAPQDEASLTKKFET